MDRSPGFILPIGPIRDGLTIGDLAERSQVSRDTLRFSERRRLLSAPRRTASGYRLYREDDANRVRLIRRAQAMGLTLEDIRNCFGPTLDTADSSSSRLATPRGIEAVDKKIAELRVFRAELARGLRDCERAGAAPSCCPVVLDLAANGARKGGKR